MTTKAVLPEDSVQTVTVDAGGSNVTLTGPAFRAVMLALRNGSPDERRRVYQDLLRRVGTILNSDTARRSDLRPRG